MSDVMRLVGRVQQVTIDFEETMAEVSRKIGSDRVDPRVIAIVDELEDAIERAASRALGALLRLDEEAGRLS